MLVLGVAGTASAQDAHSFFGEAYGSYATLGNAVLAGKTAPTDLVAEGPGVTHKNTLATANVPKLVTAGLIDTSVASGATSDGVQTTSNTDISDLNVLAGLIRARAITASSVTSDTSGGFSVSGQGSTLVGLSIGGKPINVTPGPNTTLSIPGIGRLVINEQIRDIGSDSASLTVNMLHLYLTASVHGLPIGTEVIVGHAVSGLAPPNTVLPTLCGKAYSTQVQVGTLVKSGPSWAANVCVKNGSHTSRNAGLGLNLPGILTGGTLANFATATGTDAATTGEASSTAQSINLLKGLVKATVIKADVNALVTPADTTFSDSGSELLGLSVGGHAVSPNPAANTEISLGNIHVYLHRVIRDSQSITVHMIEVVIDGPNVYGLNPGTDIQVATATLATS